MRRKGRLRRSYLPSVDGLETRGLLSAGGAIVSAAIRGIPAGLIPPIRGTITGTVTNMTQLSPTSEMVSYTARGKANIIGDGKGSGQHVITSKALKNGTSRDTYKNGSATVKGTTDTVAIRYKGTGHTNADGSFTATWKGTARSVAGTNAGLSGSFAAKISGSSRTGSFTITFSISL